MVWLDTSNRIIGMNDLARRVLASIPGAAVGENILNLHPEASRDKVQWLIDAPSSRGEASPPMTMMINTPERVLLIKVSKITGAEEAVGTCMIFYDVTAETMRPVETTSTAAADAGVQELYKLPVYKKDQVLLVDLEDVSCIKADGRYSTVYAGQETFFCSLSLSDLEKRLNADRFYRVHRSYLVNLKAAKAFQKADDSSCLVVDHGDGMKVPISRNRISDLKNRLGLG